MSTPSSHQPPYQPPAPLPHQVPHQPPYQPPAPLPHQVPHPPPHGHVDHSGAPPAQRPAPKKVAAWLIGGIGGIAAIGIPFVELVYKPMLVDMASDIAQQAGWLGQRPTDWNAEAFSTFRALTIVQVAVPLVAYLLAVAGITRRHRQGVSVALFGSATLLGVLSVMMASIHPRLNPGLGARTERFADRFGTDDPNVLAVLWQTATGVQVMSICCGVLIAILAARTWWNGRSRRPRAAWPWLLPLPVIVSFAIAGQLTSSLTTFTR